MLNLARAQRGMGIDARVITLNRRFTDPSVVLPGEDAFEGVPVRRLRWWGSSRYPFAPSVLGAIAGARLVHVHGVDFFFDFLALTRIFHRRTMVATTHGGFFHTAYASRLKKIWFATVTRASIRAYDAIVACSVGDADRFAPIGAGRVRMIENGVDFDKLASGGPAARDPRRLLSFGRFCAHKRIDAVFAVLAALRARGGDWNLVIAGSPADVSEEDLRFAAAEAGVGEHVRFVIAPGDAALADEAARASIFICASAHEGFGIAAVEAASCGLVPVLSPIPPFERLIDRLGAGLLIDPDDPEAAARIIHSLAETDLSQSRARLMARARGYAWQDAARRYSNIYETARAREPGGLVAT